MLWWCLPRRGGVGFLMEPSNLPSLPAVLTLPAPPAQPYSTATLLRTLCLTPDPATKGSGLPVAIASGQWPWGAWRHEGRLGLGQCHHLSSSCNQKPFLGCRGEQSDTHQTHATGSPFPLQRGINAHMGWNMLEDTHILACPTNRVSEIADVWTHCYVLTVWVYIALQREYRAPWLKLKFFFLYIICVIYELQSHCLKSELIINK